jgi:hypothetical protein
MQSDDDVEVVRKYINKKYIKWNNRKRKIYVDNLLNVINKGNEF